MAGMSIRGNIPCPVAEWARQHPEGIALRVGSDTRTWQSLHVAVGQREAALRAAGIGQGSRVGIAMPASPETVVLLIALFRIGAVACPVDPAFPSDYRKPLLDRLACTLVLDDTFGFEKAETTLDHSPVWNAEAPATIIFTSGSTGEPKAAVLSLGNHLAAARASNRNIRLAPGDGWLLSLPLHHVAGFGVLFRCLSAGATVVLPGEDGILEACASPWTTHVSLVARQLAQLVEREPIPELRGLLLGGSAIPAPLLDRAFDRGLPLHTSYGMTEMATQAATTPPGASRRILESAGRPLAPGSLRIEATGRIAVGGPARFLGYWEEGRLVEPFDAEGWFRTGDCGHFDEDGYLHVTGRIDNMFIAGGENIQPESIERALLQLPGITRAVVVPVPHPEFGATPVAFVECEGPVQPEEIREALLRVLPRFLVPKHLLPWPSDGLGAGMKINRRAFAALAAQRIPQASQD